MWNHTSQAVAFQLPLLIRQLLKQRRSVHALNTMALRLAPVLFFVALLGVAVLDAQHSTASKGAGDWTPKRYPDPTQDPEACGRPGVEHSWVCDPDGILSVEQRNVVEGILKAIAAGEQPYAKAACGSAGEVGAQVRAWARMVHPASFQIFCLPSSCPRTAIKTGISECLG